MVLCYKNLSPDSQNIHMNLNCNARVSIRQRALNESNVEYRMAAARRGVQSSRSNLKVAVPITDNPHGFLECARMHRA